MQSRNGNWVTGFMLIAIHAVALLAFLPGLFHWSSLAVMAVLIYLSGGIGIALGFHRTLTHRSLQLWKPLEYAVSICGCLALQGSPIDWVATHRAHHAHSDQPGDPHDSLEGFRWSHFLWMMFPNASILTDAERHHYGADLYADPFYRFLDRYHLGFTALLAIGLALTGGLSFVVWGIFVRLVLVYQVTWLVNSAAHSVGYQSFVTGDRSTNCWWLALLGWGEGWHNNHHAFPFSARHGLRWFEFDATWLLIAVLRFTRLARDVKLPTALMLRRTARSG